MAARSSINPSVSLILIVISIHLQSVRLFEKWNPFKKVKDE